MDEWGIHDIQVLSHFEGVRKRPEMYIGSTSVWGTVSVIYSAFSLMLESLPTRVDIIIENYTYKFISDRGIKLLKSEQEMTEYTLEKVTPFLHYTYPELFVYALSESLQGMVITNSQKITFSYRDGECKTFEQTKHDSTEEMTVIEFKLDNKILEQTVLNQSMLISMVKRISYLQPGIKYSVSINEEQHHFYCEDSVKTCFEALSITHLLLHEPIRVKHEIGECSVDLMFAFYLGLEHQTHFHVNGHVLKEGTHLDGYLTGIKKLLLKFGIEEEKAYKTVAVGKLTLNCVSISYKKNGNTNLVDYTLNHEEAGELLEKAVEESSKQFMENDALKGSLKHLCECAYLTDFNLSM